VWKGFDEPVAALFVGLFAFFQIPLRIVAGYVADRWSMPRVSALAALAGLGAVLVLVYGENGWIGTGLLFAFLFALGETGNSPAWAAIGHFFGRANYATIRGAVSLAQSVISLPAPVVAGWLYDTTESYQLALLPIGGCYLAAFLLFWMLRRPQKRLPVQEP
jgi:nitrate/nitrite transporter NarK